MKKTIVIQSVAVLLLAGVLLVNVQVSKAVCKAMQERLYRYKSPCSGAGRAAG